MRVVDCMHMHVCNDHCKDHVRLQVGCHLLSASNSDVRVEYIRARVRLFFEVSSNVGVSVLCYVME